MSKITEHEALMIELKQLLRKRPDLKSNIDYDKIKYDDRIKILSESIQKVSLICKRYKEDR